MKKLGKTAFLLLMGIMAGLSWEKNATDKTKRVADKHLSLFLMMNQWVRIKQEGKNLADYLHNYNFKTIAIYGMSYVGERFLNELKDTDIIVEYGIDKEADAIYSDIKVISPNESLEAVDAVIVTSIFYMDEIKEVLSHKLACPIISLEDIIYEL